MVLDLILSALVVFVHRGRNRVEDSRSLLLAIISSSILQRFKPDRNRVEQQNRAAGIRVE